MAFEQGYPSNAVIKTYLSDAGVETVEENNCDYWTQWLQMQYRILKRTEGAAALEVYANDSDSLLVKPGRYIWNGVHKTYAGAAEIDPTNNDTTYVWMGSDFVVSSAIDGTGWPASAHMKLAEVAVGATGLITTITDRRTPIMKVPDEFDKGYIGIPLASWREVVANDIAISDAGGILCKDTTPILEYISGDADSCLRLNWVANDLDPIVAQFPLPPDFDTNNNMTFHARIASDDMSDVVGFALDTYFNEGDTKIEDATTTVATSDIYTEVTATIALADIPSGAQTCTIELTPIAHDSDAMWCTGTWVTYTRQ